MKYKNVAYISRRAILQNYGGIRAVMRKNLEKIGDVREEGALPRVISVVKADAYGHGISIMARALYDAGCRYFAVSSEAEAVELRGLCEEAEILILSRIAPENVGEMIENGIICAVTSLENAAALSAEAERAGGVLRVHIKLDTGMNRVGLTVREKSILSAADEIEVISHLGGIKICGIFTHFSSADDELLDGKIVEGSENFGGYTQMQLSRFSAVIDEAKRRGIDVGLVHAANSAAIMGLPEAYFDAVRAGIILYGYPPNGKSSPYFAPVMRFEATVTRIHDMKKGEKISYGATYMAERDMKIATVSAGYADGFERCYKGCEIMIRGEKFPQVGRICMDQFMIDITDASSNIREGDTVTLFGGDSGESCEALASLSSTISYEILCRVSRRVRRVEE